MELLNNFGVRWQAARTRIANNDDDKNKVYQLGGGHLHDENGGRLLHEWLLLMSLLWRPSPSDRSTLAAKLLKASLPQNFLTLFFPKKLSVVVISKKV